MNVKPWIRSLLPFSGRLLLAGSLLALGGCGGGGGGGSAAPTAPPAASGATPPASSGSGASADSQSPQVAERRPQEQASEVSTTAKVVVIFDEALDADSIDNSSLMVSEQAQPVPGSVTYDAANVSLVFTADQPLAAETVYGVTVASTVMDMAGNPFPGDDWFFTTGGPFNLGATTQITIDQCMSDGDKRMLTLVNQSREAGATCGADDLPVQPSLSWSCLLDAAATGHSTSMATNDFHAHTSPVDGSDAGDRIRATGYTPRSWGENIAAGYADVDRVMEGWLSSAGHCSNLMSPVFTEMGAGFAEDAGSTYGIYWTQNFGDPQ